MPVFLGRQLFPDINIQYLNHKSHFIRTVNKSKLSFLLMNVIWFVYFIIDKNSTTMQVAVNQIYL